MKDADGLDRVRLYDLDPSYLRHAATRRWIQGATLLHDETVDSQDPLEIWHAAARLGLPVDALTDYAAGTADHLLGGPQLLQQ